MARIRPLIVVSAVIVFLIGGGAGPAAHAAETVDDLPRGVPGRVATVIDGDTVRLADGDADIRLVGIQAPKLPLGRRGFKAWPLADQSRAALVDLVENRTVTPALGPTVRDRNGRNLAHLIRDDGLWVQGEMLRLGMARIYTFPDNRRLIDAMRAMEHDARNAKRGIWADPFYAIRSAADPAALRRDIGSFQIVAGTVVDAARTRDRIYLNFGDDYRSDFTVSIDQSDWATFKASEVDPLAYQGRAIEVRGWLVSRNGPMIEVTHPEQIEMVAD